jgi:hypothetical protein
MDLWLCALASVDFNLMYESSYTVDVFRDALLENNTIDLNMAYINITGSVPSVVSEFIESNTDMRRVDLADHLSRLRYNYQKIRRRPVHYHQVCSLATQIIDSDTLPTDMRRKSYIQTRRKLIEQGISTEKASAFAFEMHRTGTVHADTIPEVTLVDTVDLYLPNAYLAVGAGGDLTVVDSTQGVYGIRTSPPLPNQWMCRVSPDTNEFIIGDEHRCVHVSLTPEGDGVMQTPIALPTITRPTCVDNRWVVWGSKARPSAFEWREGKAVMCSVDDARKHVVSLGKKISSEGNRIMLGSDTLVKLPMGESISCMYGNAREVDVVTTSRDFWRIDVRGNRAECVGLPIDYKLAAMAPLVGWV